MSTLNNALMKTIEIAYSLIPRSKPEAEVLRNVKIVAHRGIHEPKDVLENSHAAFQLAHERKVWGIEFDVRWTKDSVPVVLHDKSPQRVFPDFYNSSSLFKGADISQLSFDEIRREEPQIPSLEELVVLYGKKLHFFIELKEPLNTPLRKSRFQEILKPLEPWLNYHVMSLEPQYFNELNFLPKTSFLPVAEWNIGKLSELSLAHSWAGLTGHFLLLSDSVLKRHHHHQQLCGTGFINTKNLLFRELHRQVEWIFTDKALSLQATLDKALKS